MKNFKDRGFTLIELLIVVAIIAILAAIAVPNFLEAQTRAKVSRVKSDLRTMATAMEAYYIDNNSYTKDNEGAMDVTQTAITYDQRANGAIELTTPIAYISSIMSDPFAPKDNSVGASQTYGYRIGSGDWSYPPGTMPKDEQDAIATFAQKGQVSAWVSFSPGPDEVRNRNSYKCFPWKPVGTKDAAKPGPTFYLDYDPTNGSISKGDIYRYGGQYMRGDWDRFDLGSGPSGPDQN